MSQHIRTWHAFLVLVLLLLLVAAVFAVAAAAVADLTNFETSGNVATMAKRAIQVQHVSTYSNHCGTENWQTGLLATLVQRTWHICLMVVNPPVAAAWGQPGQQHGWCSYFPRNISIA